MSQSLCCFVTTGAGFVTMLALGASFRAHNPFLGYEGDYDEAASSCFKTAVVFGILSAVSALFFVYKAVRSKMSPQSIIRGDYEAV